MRKGKNTSSVTLIERLLKSGNTQLLLQIYVEGNRVQESTGILILPTDNKRIIREKRAAAELYRSKREEEVRAYLLGEVYDAERIEDPIYPYIDKVAMSKPALTTRANYMYLKSIMLDYDSNKMLTFRMVNKEWIRGFRSYLLGMNTIEKTNKKKKSICKKHVIAQNTAAARFQTFIAIIHQAVADDIYKKDPSIGIKRIPIAETERQFLDEEELRALSNTPCDKEVIKRAFLFSCFTGLRFSDIKALEWSNIYETDGRLRIGIRMKKTSSIIFQEISQLAASYLGIRKFGVVFEGLTANCLTNEYISRWVARSGIKKRITFHCARHTFATLLLKQKTDIYTVSKLLGHRKITTTQIYAKVVDDTKREAVDSLNNILKAPIEPKMKIS